MATLTAIRIVADDWGSPLRPVDRVFMAPGEEVVREEGMGATTLRPRTAIDTARGVVLSRASRRPSIRMLIVDLDTDDLIRHSGDYICARRLRVVKEITGEELEQIADGYLTALDAELTAQAA